MHCVHRAQLFFEPKDVSIRFCLTFSSFLISLIAVANKIACYSNDVVLHFLHCLEKIKKRGKYGNDVNNQVRIALACGH